MKHGIIFKATLAISVQCPNKKFVVILFQPVTLTCNFQTTSTQPPIITWKYKSYCRDPIQAAINPSSADNALAQNNPNYDPNIECSDSQRTVRIVASKQAGSVSLGTDYQGRKISIINNADLNIAQTAWGDSGVYLCSVVSAQDLQGNSEDYVEVIVLEHGIMMKLFPSLVWVCILYLMILYEAGKAVKKGIPSQYAATLYAPSMYSQPMSAMPLVPMANGMAPPQNGYGHDYDGASSVGQGSQVPLLRDQDARSGYRIHVDSEGNATRAIYYMEKELAALDPSRPANYKLDNMSEVSSLHDSVEPRGRGGRSHVTPMATVYDQDEAMSTISSVSQQGQRRDDYARRGGGHMESRVRARSMDNLDDIGRRHRDDYPLHRRPDEPRGRRGSDDEWSSSARSGYDRDYDDRRRRDYSPDDRGGRGGGGYSDLAGRRSRSRDDLMDLERDRRFGNDARGGRDDYDDSFLREAMERKKLGEQQRARSRERLDSESDRLDRDRAPRGPPPLPMSPPSGYPGRRDDYPPSQPPAYSDNESASSSKKSNLRKNGAVSRESLVV
uniref:Lipolysis stimulated lipoprotein receptor n=1 Tax=Kryptolebias marmoratus TaxID=37003 RepID=A0A3Q3BN63_KRYMA